MDPSADTLLSLAAGNHQYPYFIYHHKIFKLFNHILTQQTFPATSSKPTTVFFELFDIFNSPIVLSDNVGQPSRSNFRFQ
jgi:hypothetical protein